MVIRNNLVERRGHAEWVGDVDHGSGVVELRRLMQPFNKLSRQEEEARAGMSPEELFCGAVASCYIVGLGYVLEQYGYPFKFLFVDAITVSELEPDGGLPLRGLRLLVRIRSYEPNIAKLQDWVYEAIGSSSILVWMPDLPINIEIEHTQLLQTS